ncbi:MAG: PhzF family phenazine biosynthesis protein [Defluviitaleaceae bacterium]|nr:PhzF family phenazine biosynthesis protein [Defluviitaleaceae bacterium]
MKLYQIDSFTSQLFSGNPAAVCFVYDTWPSDELMQNIAMENNLSETAFVLRSGIDMHIRWFTPTAEIGLCGHGTLAAAHALFAHEGAQEKELVFECGRGILKVAYEGDLLTLDFPGDNVYEIDFQPQLDCFQFTPKEVWRGTEEYILVFESEAQVKTAVCDLAKAARIDLSGIIITAASSQLGVDFVSRYFTPKYGIAEDPVTGSAHTLLVPYWQKIMGKDSFRALQISERGGELFCRAEGDRVKIGGRAVTYSIGEILL